MVNRIILKEEEAINFIEQNNIQVRSYEQSYIVELTKKLESFNIEGYSKFVIKYNFVQYENGPYKLSFVEPALIVDGIEYCINNENNGKYSIDVSLQSSMLRNNLIDHVRSKLCDYDYVTRHLQRPNNIGKATKKKITDWVEYATTRHNLMMDAYKKALEMNQDTYKAFAEKYPDLEVSRNDVDGWVKTMYFTKQYEDHDIRYELMAGTDGTFFVNSRVWRTAKIEDLLK